MQRIEPFKLSLKAISELTGESLPLIHDAINAGHLDTFLVGRRCFARPGAVAGWVRFLGLRSKAGKPGSYPAPSADRLEAAA